MTDERDDLRDAFRAVRDRYDGQNAEADATLTRALFRARALDRKRRVQRWVVLPIAAAFVASTAWAGVTGRLPKAITSLLEPTHIEHAPPPASPPAPVAPVVSPSPAEEPASPEPSPPPPAPSPPPPRPVASAPAVPAVPSPAPTPSTVASTNDPHANLFAEAHRIHFTEKDPTRAIAAWDRYLDAAPNGRFAPEARYNRALALVRVGRHAEAKKELQAFANGAFGDYRREEARALLDALARDE